MIIKGKTNNPKIDTDKNTDKKLSDHTLFCRWHLSLGRYPRGLTPLNNVLHNGRRFLGGNKKRAQSEDGGYRSDKHKC